MMWGGGSVAAARRAGRYGLGYLAQGDAPGSLEAYEEACRANGHEPGMTLLPNRDTPSVCFVAPDVDTAWREIGEHLLHDARMYAEWNPGNETSAGIADVSNVDELRSTSRTHRIFAADEAIAYVRGGGMLTLAPLCGGIPPDIAWKYLRYVDDAVMPALQHNDG
jgi:alkanesulfonate monooxygenase SsuD/methylene tetrahydromethanopterin reductase-like flavin-dependent oxidoreductase (luciferase family)